MSEIKKWVHVNGNVYALIPLTLVKELNKVLDNYHFSDGGYTNNDDVINVQEKLQPFVDY